ncbi:MAG TPA: HAMP domain-containing sensor histidine kinase [Gemmatimonadaceae bacterium]|nr:HAMP domain-containing sensor histidine kinase [Gemmatimonadaceae bacterium]
MAAARKRGAGADSSADSPTTFSPAGERAADAVPPAASPAPPPRPDRRTPRNSTERIAATFLPYDSEELDAAAADTTVVAWHALTRSAAHVYRDWEHSPQAAARGADVHAPLATLCEGVRDGAEGRVPDFKQLAPNVPARALLDALRRAFLEQVLLVEEHLSAGQVVAVLRGFEAAQQVLDRDPAHRFATMLAGMDAMELVVEVAHDMRSPLGSILFLAERLRKGQSGIVNSIQERQLGLVYSAAFGLSSLASDVIELARGGDRLVDRKPVPFSVTELMQAVRDIVLPIAEEKGLEIRLAFPESDSRMGYPAALNRVLLNLTTNALKFTAAGSVEVTARQLRRTQMEFSVQDTGRGIPAPVMTTLFDSFRERQKPGEYAFSSAGLGLSICQKLVAAMGGVLQVDTSPETGTRFHFTLDLPPANAL